MKNLCVLFICIQILIEYGSIANALDNKDEQLFNAVMADTEVISDIRHLIKQGHTNATEILIEKGSNVNSQDVFKMTPLHLAANTGSVDTIKLLIERGASVNAQDIDKVTPLHNAATYFDIDNIDPIKLLIERGANVCAKDNKGCTPYEKRVRSFPIITREFADLVRCHE